jgi:hypothetical protein
MAAMGFVGSSPSGRDLIFVHVNVAFSEDEYSARPRRIRPSSIVVSREFGMCASMVPSLDALWREAKAVRMPAATNCGGETDSKH